MDQIDQECDSWLAEMNRRILAGRPVAASDLSAFEEAYARVSDQWGPPGGLRPTAPLQQATLRRASQPVLITHARQ